MKHRAIPGLVLLCLAITPLMANDEANQQTQIPVRTVLGYVEPISVLPDGIEVEARLDSGASTSSMHALEIEVLEDGDNGDKRVKFVFESDDKRMTVERPLVRHTNIVQHSGERDRRPVVMMDFCMAGQQYEAEFTLTDRSALTYPVLLGRRFMGDVTLIDPAVSRISSPDCPE